METRRWIGRRFERGELVGRGGSGSVYRALDRSTGQSVAVKVLAESDPRSLERFEQEARALADLVHPHVVRYVDHGRTDEGEAFLAMEWLEGESLASTLARGALPLRESIELGRAVADALAAAHARGVVHRDIKPSNLFLEGGLPGRVRVLDFGLAHVTGTSGVITRTGGVLGTPGYMAPEQARGDEGAIVDGRADLFSLGAVLFECLTGRRAFEGVHMMALLAQLLLADVPRVRETLPGVPSALDELVARLLAKDPDERPEDAAEVERALSALGAGPVPARLSVAPAPAITTDEQRLLAVIAIAPDPAESEDAASVVRRVAGPRGARVDELSGGTLLVTPAGRANPTVQAEDAARCALGLREALRGANMALAMGRGLSGGRLPVGAVATRAAELLLAGHVASGTASVVRIDGVTRALLDERFITEPDGAAFVLAGERAIGEGARTLLGQTTPYVGREREMRMLLDLVAATFDGDRGAQAAIVTGAPGMGKTRLRHELVKRLRAARPEVAIGIGRADAMSAGAAFVAVGSALRNAMGLAADESGQAARVHMLERIAPYVPARERRRVAAFLGEITGVPFPSDGDADLAAARSNGARMAEEVSRAFVDFLRGVCADHPVLLVLEDLHWGDAASVRLVDDALRELADRPFVVLALGRPEVEEVFPDLWSRREVQSVRLGALARRAAEELVMRALGRALAPEELARVVEQAGGNAFYLEELIRALAEGRGDRLPETVLGMVQARLEGLPGEARRLLRAASVFGEVFSKGGALALLGEGERTDAARTWLPWLTERELLVRRAAPRPGAEEEYAFRHALLREGSYAMLTAEDLVLGHRLAAEWMVRTGSGKGARDATIAEHFFRAEAWEEAAQAFATAARAAARLHANAEARLHYDRALSALRRAPDSVDVRRRRVDAMIEKVAVSYGDDPGPNLALLAEAEALAAELPEATMAPSEDYRRVARVLFWMGRCHWYRNAYSEAIACYQRTLAAAQHLDDDELTALPAGTIGRVMMAQGHFARCLPFLERAVSSLERGGHLGEWAVNVGFIGVVAAAGGRFEEAIARGEQALARARSIESLTSVSICETILGGIHVFAGAPERGIELLRAAADDAERAGDRVYAYLAYGFGAWAASRGGDHIEATQRMARSRAVTEELGRRLVFADWFEAFSVEAAQRAGRVDEALLSAPRFAAAFRASGSIFAEGIVQRAWGLALAARSPHMLDAATAHLGESLLLLAMGEAHAETSRTRRALEGLY